GVLNPAAARWVREWAEPRRWLDWWRGKAEQPSPAPSPPAPPAPRIRVVVQAEPAPPRPVAPERPRHRPPEAAVPRIPLLSYECASGQAVQVVIPPALARKLSQHAEESARRQVEVGGFLLGTVEQLVRLGPEGAPAGGPGGYRVTVTDLVPVRSPSSSLSHIQFDEKAWALLGEECDRRFSREGKLRLGWYHTHPNQGIFFSSQDLNC